MNLHEAIMKAADHIERFPKDFDYDYSHIPDRCGSPSCAIGWIGHFLGVPLDLCVTVHATQIIGVDWENTFTTRMDRLEAPNQEWRESAAECARCLRLYADQYHGDERRNFARELTERLASAPRIPEEA